jgi:hypothetical protein
MNGNDDDNDLYLPIGDEHPLWRQAELIAGAPPRPAPGYSSIGIFQISGDLGPATRGIFAKSVGPYPKSRGNSPLQPL